eukprot:CAMPEP_0185269218 /NCGR_PEP_ID=MMETSP1359-20130426/39168_1 /TAXON_ID=552665 /ORGANISM="Bigelowiella longifila, Strain CCMP242" /LENGTH=317 /DNA_ID=CAMNT_0027860289 /DNA_START=24 /DNA_END=977 /DNA_ORIENTATION=-
MLARLCKARPDQVDRRDRELKTPLHVAVNATNLAAVKTLVHHGASCTALDRSGQSPLLAAVWCLKHTRPTTSFANSEILSFLTRHAFLEDSSIFSRPDDRGQTVESLADEHPSLIGVSIARGMRKIGKWGKAIIRHLQSKARLADSLVFIIAGYLCSCDAQMTREIFDIRPGSKAPQRQRQRQRCPPPQKGATARAATKKHIPLQSRPASARGSVCRSSTTRSVTSGSHRNSANRARRAVAGGGASDKKCRSSSSSHRGRASSASHSASRSGGRGKARGRLGKESHASSKTGRNNRFSSVASSSSSLSSRTNGKRQN